MTDKEVSIIFLSELSIDNLGRKYVPMDKFCILFKNEAEAILRRLKDFMSIDRIRIPSKKSDKASFYEKVILNQYGELYFQQLREDMGKEKCSNRECSFKSRCSRFTENEGYSVFKPVIYYPCTYYKEKI